MARTVLFNTELFVGDDGAVHFDAAWVNPNDMRVIAKDYKEPGDLFSVASVLQELIDNYNISSRTVQRLLDALQHE